MQGITSNEPKLSWTFFEFPKPGELRIFQVFESQAGELRTFQVFEANFEFPKPSELRTFQVFEAKLRPSSCVRVEQIEGKCSELRMNTKWY